MANLVNKSFDNPDDLVPWDANPDKTTVNTLEFGTVKAPPSSFSWMQATQLRRDCDSGCRGIEPRFSPHFLLGILETFN